MAETVWDRIKTTPRRWVIANDGGLPLEFTGCVLAGGPFTDAAAALRYEAIGPDNWISKHGLRSPGVVVYETTGGNKIISYEVRGILGVTPHRYFAQTCNNWTAEDLAQISNHVTEEIRLAVLGKTTQIID